MKATDRRDSHRVMEGIGLSVGETNKKNLAARRVKMGLCATCGTTKTHKVGFFGKKTALTVEGESLYGKCLRCNPIEGYQVRPLDSPFHNEVPRTIDATNHYIADDGTLVSGITMDHRLLQRERTWASGISDEFDSESIEDSHLDYMPHVRPEPSVGTIGIDTGRPERPSRRAKSYNNGDSTPPLLPKPRRHTSYERLRQEARMDAIGSEMDTVYSDMSKPGKPPKSSRPKRTSAVTRDALTSVPAPRMHPDITPMRQLSPGRDDFARVDIPAAPTISPFERSSESSTHRSHELAGERNDSSWGTSRSHATKHSDYHSATRPSEAVEREGSLQGPHLPHLSSSRPTQPVRTHIQIANNTAGFIEEDEEEKSEIVAEESWTGSEPFYASNSRQRGNQKFDDDIRGNPLNALPRGGSFDSNEYHPTGEQELRPRRNEGPQDRFNASFPPLSPHRYAARSPGDVRPSTGVRVSPRAGALNHSPHGHMGREEREAKAHSRDALSIWSSGEQPPPLMDRTRRGQPDDGNSDDPMPRRPGAKKITAQSAAPLAVANPRVERRIGDFAHFDDGPLQRPRQELKRADSIKETKQDLADIPVLIDSLNLEEANANIREQAFRSLADIVWNHGQQAKSSIQEYHGIETFVNSMWADMGDPLVQAAASELLFALAASTDGKADNDVLVGFSAESAVDALLISMETHISVESIQRSGCGTLGCLASASGDNRRINDGSLSGAVLCVTNAMDVHRTSSEVQRWGVRALYNQCVISLNREQNKSTFVSTTIDGTGMYVIFRGMDIVGSELVTLEWAWRLCWCLFANDQIAGALSNNPQPLYSILNAIKLYRGKQEAGTLVEAALGALANLAKVEECRVLCWDAGVVSVVLESMSFYARNEGVNIEACTVLANLANAPDCKDKIIRSAGAGKITEALRNFPRSMALQEEAFRALLCLSVGMEESKVVLSSDGTLAWVMQTLARHVESLAVEEMAYHLLSSLCVHRNSAKLVVKQGVVPLVIAAMKAKPKEKKVQEAICSIWRNLACHGEAVDECLGLDALKALVLVMNSHLESESIQLNACCAIWNLCSKSTTNPTTLADAGCIECLVKVIQSRMESASVQEMACGALWNLVDRSDECKQRIVDSGGIDAVACTLMMHLHSPQTLEKACGVFSNVSVKRALAEAIAEAQGVSNVVDAMRNNSTAVGLLEFGALVLRNVVLANQTYASEVSNGISTIINCMRMHPAAVGLQREACNALWAMAAHSEECKSKIMALDGATVIMNTLEQNVSNNDVEEAARGAINQLA